MKLYLPVLSLLFFATINAQPMTTIPFANLEEGVRNVFFNECIEVSNIHFTGSNSSIGEYSSQLGELFNSGLIISTGKIEIACGPNNSPSAGYDFQRPGDPYLESLQTLGEESYDAAILEFDFVSQTDSIIAGGFVFGSEEFPEYYETSFNDMFAISIDRNDTSYQVPYNIAQIPATGEPVGISSIAPNGANVLYVSNPTGSEILQWDGFTQPVSFSHDVIPGVSYHVRISIADLGDGIYDSGVLFANGSFSCAQDFYGEFIVLQPDTYNDTDTVVQPETAISSEIFKYKMVDGLLFIDCSSYENVNGSLTVFDLSGRTVSEKKMNGLGGTEIIDLQSSTSGIYFLRITYEGKVLTHKILR